MVVLLLSLFVVVGVVVVVVVVIVVVDLLFFVVYCYILHHMRVGVTFFTGSHFLPGLIFLMQSRSSKRRR